VASLLTAPLHRVPQPVGVHGLHVHLDLLPAPGRDDRVAVLVHLHHEGVGLALGVAEVALEDVGDVVHEVDRIVPDDGHPRFGTTDVSLEMRGLLWCGCHGHRATLGPPASGVPYGCPMGTALLTDRYELTMLQAALADGTADRHCVFEVFT